MTRTSIIIITHNEGESLFLTVEALLHTCPGDCELVVVNDHSTDGSLDFLSTGSWPRVRRLDLPRRGIAEARNEGARLAQGEVLVFLDAHCIPKRDWLPPLLETLDREPEVIAAPCISVLGHTAARGFGADLVGRDLHYEWRTRPHRPQAHPVPIAGGCGLTMRRDYFLDLGGFDPMRIYGLEDVELCLRSWLLGDGVRNVPESEVAHLFKPAANYEVRWRDYLYNRLRVAVLHFEGARRERLLAHWRPLPAFAEAQALLEASDAHARRDRLRPLRRREADWFCTEFGVEI